MASNDKNGWRCPICETLNTGDICTICGTKIEQKAEILEASKYNRNKNTPGLQTEISVTDNSSKDSAEELQWRTDRWNRIVAIVILAVISLTFIIYVYIATGTDHLSDNGYRDDENILIEDETDIVFWDSDNIDQICNQLDIVNVEISGGYNDNFGLNKYDEFVYWSILIQINDDLETVTAIQASWTDNVSCINDSIYVGCEHEDHGWQSILNGNTHWYSYTNYDNANIIDIKLPDDPGIAGEQYIIINGVKINFSLNYLGDYITGIGWDISDIFVTLASSNPDHNNAISNQPDEPEFTILGVQCTGAWNDEVGYGLNEYGDMVYWVLEVELDNYTDMHDAIDTYINENYTVYCSWQGDPLTCIDWKGDQYINGGWDEVNCGATLWRTSIMAEPLTYYVEILLPDNEAIAGKQYIKINNQTIEFYLEYCGDYSTAGM